MIQLQQLLPFLERLKQNVLPLNSDKDMKIYVKLGDKNCLALFDSGSKFNIVTENVNKGFN